MQTNFIILQQSRKKILELIHPLSEKQLWTIPAGFNNNIFWNMVHLLASQQALCYKLANVPLHLDDYWVSNYRKGTFPQHEEDLTRLNQLKESFIELAYQAEKDYYNDYFNQAFQVYETSVNITLRNIDEAISFNNLHEGLHWGSILALRKLV